jgi:hypothetical protein
MLEQPLFRTLDALATAARTLDTMIASGSIENARAALVDGRRGRVLRMILEDLEDPKLDAATRRGWEQTG